MQVTKDTKWDRPTLPPLVKSATTDPLLRGGLLCDEMGLGIDARRCRRLSSSSFVVVCRRRRWLCFIYLFCIVFLY